MNAAVVPFEAVHNDSLSGRIVSQVKAALFAGQLKSGDFLGSEASLAERFEVSRMAVRDALHGLEAAGIVEIRMGAKGGAWIAQANAERFADALAIQLELIGVSVDELLDSQIAIEVMAADLAATAATEDDLGRMRTALERLGGRRGDAASFTEAAMEFHQTVVEASHNRALTVQFKGLRLLLQPLYTSTNRPEVMDRVIASHRSLLSAIQARDADGAREIMLARLRQIHTSIRGAR